MDGRTDGQGESYIHPPNFVCGGYNKAKKRLEKQVCIALRCITTKHGYQSKTTYEKVVRKHKMDSYIVG